MSYSGVDMLSRGYVFVFARLGGGDCVQRSQLFLPTNQREGLFVLVWSGLIAWR